MIVPFLFSSGTNRVENDLGHEETIQLWKSWKQVLQRATLHCKHWNVVSTDLPDNVLVPNLLQWMQTFFLPSILTIKGDPTFPSSRDKFSILLRLAEWLTETVEENPPINCLARLILKFNCLNLPSPCSCLWWLNRMNEFHLEISN